MKEGMVIKGVRTLMMVSLLPSACAAVWMIVCVFTPATWATEGGRTASSDGVVYATLQEALDRAADGSTVKLHTNASSAVLGEGKTVVLEMGNHRIEGCLENNGTLSIRARRRGGVFDEDCAIKNTGTGRLTIEGGAYEGGHTAIENAGVLTLASGTVEGESCGIAMTGGSTEICGGTVTATSGSGITADAGASLRVTGGSVATQAGSGAAAIAARESVVTVGAQANVSGNCAISARESRIHIEDWSCIDGRFTLLLPEDWEAADHSDGLFYDVADDTWYHDAIQAACRDGLMSGSENHRFYPDSYASRCVLLEILYRMNGSPAVTLVSVPFDVEDGAWYADAASWGWEKGIVTGYADGTLGAMDALTREQAATLLYRYAQYKGYDVSPRSDLSAFDDADEIAQYAREPMEWAYAAGLILGTSGSTMSPQAPVTRAQAAILAQRLLAYEAEQAKAA